MFVYLAPFVIAFLVTAMATPLAIKIAPKIGAMDVPKDSRRMHKKPIPRFGGIAIYAGFLAAFIYNGIFTQQAMGIIVGATLILVLGICDDIKGMPAKVKLLGQIACAAVLYFNTIQIRGMANILPIGPWYISFPKLIAFWVTVLWIVAITNTINLIDGLDGLASGISFISCLSVAYTAYVTSSVEKCQLILSLAGATLGFLLWNFHPAKIFMGDGGSMQLGFLLAAISLIGDKPTKGTTLFACIIPVIILALPIFDTCFAIVRRAWNHQPIMQADKGHLHHRIMAMGFGQRRTVLALYCISGVMGVAGILWTIRERLACAVLALIGATLVFIFLGIGVVDSSTGKRIEKPLKQESCHNLQESGESTCSPDPNQTGEQL